jgi:hypothetical protein
MLTISQPLSSCQAQKYHAEEFTSRSQAYYAETGNVRGEWQERSPNILVCEAPCGMTISGG